MRLKVVVLSCALTLPALAAFQSHGSVCTDTSDTMIATQDALGLEGNYTLPSSEPTALVVFAHGYRNRSVDWEPHLLAAARDHGVVAVAMDYTGTGPEPDNRGWPVRAGAADLITAARHFISTCSLTDEPVVLYGISFGGNVSGYALAHGPTRPEGGRLFDHWIAVEGGLNSIETYLEARAARGSSAYVEGAVQDIEAENGGPIEATGPEPYLEISIVPRADDVVASGVQSVTLVHAPADGLVPYNQSREMAEALRARGVPVDFFSVARRNDWTNPDSADTEGGTTADGYAAPATGQLGADYRPLAGHGWEGSETHIVTMTGFARLWALLGGDVPADREYLVDSDSGTTRLL